MDSPGKIIGSTNHASLRRRCFIAWIVMMRKSKAKLHKIFFLKHSVSFIYQIKYAFDILLFFFHFR